MGARVRFAAPDRPFKQPALPSVPTGASVDQQATDAAGRVSGRVVTFGEAMIRLTPPRHERLERTISLDLTVGGAELNTAVGLVCLGVPATWVSVLPDNPLGRQIGRGARANGVDLSGVRWVPESEGRCGVYFLEEGTDPRPSAVTYDRANSAIARMQPGTFDWPTLLTGAACFHHSGITPAIGPGARAESFAAIAAARAAGVPVAFDLNYRSKLWTEEEARACFQEIVRGVDILFAGRGNLRTFFGIEGSHEEVLATTREQLGVKVAVVTRKKNRGSRGIALSSLALGPDGLGKSPWREVEIVDRLGGGDAYAAGFIAGWLENPADLTRAASLGTAAAALKHTVPGDFLSATRAEIEAVLSSDERGALQR
jgi:2-dehydro-3-deoxygluconokinase